jgi:hypothetical protein
MRRACSGGNCQFDWAKHSRFGERRLPDCRSVPNGEFVITKHEGTGGHRQHSFHQRTAFIRNGRPARYITPDVVADFTTIHLKTTAKIASRLRHQRQTEHRILQSFDRLFGGWKAVGTLVYSYPDAFEKAKAADKILRARLEKLGLKFDVILTEFVGVNATHGHLAGEPPKDIPEVQLRFGVRGQSKADVERFTKELAPLILTGPPSVTGFAGGRPKGRRNYGVFPAL